MALIGRFVSEECVDSEEEEAGGGEGVEWGGVGVNDTCTSANGARDCENKNELTCCRYTQNAWDLQNSETQGPSIVTYMQ